MPPKQSTKILFFTLSLISTYAFAEPQQQTAPVWGFARSFLPNIPIANADITILETGEHLKTDKQGQFGPVFYPIGKPITFLFQKWGYKTTQSETVKVPPEGFVGPYRNITFQVPSILIYHLFSTIIGAKIDDNACHVAATIIAHHKTLDDIPQGEPHAEVTLDPDMHEAPFYFGIFKGGPLKGKTNPFSKDLLRTSEDGGVAYFNLPVSEKPYTISAKKAGVVFSEAQFICRKGMFINISPPRGPMAQK